MSCCNNKIFNNVIDYSSVGFIAELNVNIKAFLDQAFLQIGAFTNIDTGEQFCDKNYYTLSRINTHSSKPYQIWASPQKDWVWENITYDTGTTYNPTIYIDGVDKTSDCDINYPLGQITTAETGTTFTASYSFRNVQVYTPYNSKWWMKLTRAAFDPTSSPASPLFTLLRDSAVQLPAISLETGPSDMKPRQMGSAATIVSQVIIFNIVADSAFMRDHITAIILNQNHNSFNMFNSDGASFPLNCDGTRNGSVEYADISEWKCTRMHNSGISIFESPCGDIYFARIRMVFEIYTPTKPALN